MYKVHLSYCIQRFTGPLPVNQRNTLSIASYTRKLVLKLVEVWPELPAGEQNIARKVRSVQKKLWFFLLVVALLSVPVLSLNTAFNSTAVASTSNASLSTSPASQRSDYQSSPPAIQGNYDGGYYKGEWAGRQAGVADCEANMPFYPQRKPRVAYPQTEYYRGYAAGEHDGYVAGYRICELQR